MKDLVSRQMGREEARVPGICLPSPGGGGSIAKRSGWGDGLPTRALFEGRDGHPTPPLISFASTLPLQGRSEAGRPGMTRGNNAFHRPSRRTTPIGNEARVPGIAYPPLERKGRSRSDRGGVTVSPLVHCSKGGTATPPRRSFHSRRPSPSSGGSEAGRPGMTRGKKMLFTADHNEPRRTLQKFVAAEINRFLGEWEKAEQVRCTRCSRSSAIEQSRSIHIGM